MPVSQTVDKDEVD